MDRSALTMGSNGDAKRGKGTETWRLPDDLVGAWLRAGQYGQRVQVRKGCVLYHQGDVSTYFYVIVRGRVRVSMLQANGAEFVLEFMGPGAITGEGAAFDGLPRFSSAVATEDIECIRFDALNLEEAFCQHPDLAVLLLRITGIKQRILAGRAQALTTHHPEARICEVLLRVSRTHGGANAGRRLVETNLTHQQIAEMTGISRVTVTRVLGRLRSSGAIDIVNGVIEVRRPDLLVL